MDKEQEEKIALQKKAMKSRNNPVIFQNDSFTKEEIERARERKQSLFVLIHEGASPHNEFRDSREHVTVNWHILETI